MKPPALLEQSGGVAHGRRRAVGIVNLTLTSTLVTKSGAEISFASGSPAPDIAARMRDLGMPPGHATHIRQTGQEWGDEWREYELDFLGVPVPFLAAERPPWPYFRWQGESIAVQLWQRIIRRKGSPLYLDIRWHPDHGRSVSICGLDHETPWEVVKTTHRGMGLIRDGYDGGRKYGALSVPPDVARKQALDIQRYKGMGLSWAAIGTRLQLDRKTCKERLRRLEAGEFD